MKGSRPLTPDEISRVSQAFDGQYAARNRAMFILGIKSGFRISELLSLTVGDVADANGRIVDDVTVRRRSMKSRRAGRTVPLHPEAKAALAVWVKQLRRHRQHVARYPLFPSREGKHQPLSRIQAWCILRDAYQACGLTGKLGCHALRKTFAKTVYERLDYNLVDTRDALGHANIQSTMHYLGANHDRIRAAILA
jgi:integrase